MDAVLDAWARGPPTPQWHSKRFQVATSTMALHWPGPDPAFLAGVSRFIEPGGVFLAGLHGEGSCQEGVDAFERVAGLALEGLPTMFKRRSAAEWKEALGAAGFFDIEVEERTVATRYTSAADCQRRLAAAWPPILSGHVPDADIDALVTAAAQVMIEGGTGLMTSRLLEFSACVPSVVSSKREPNVTHRDSYLPAQAWARSATPHATTRSGATPFPFKSPPEGVA